MVISFSFYAQGKKKKKKNPNRQQQQHRPGWWFFPLNSSATWTGERRGKKQKTIIHRNKRKKKNHFHKKVGISLRTFFSFSAFLSLPHVIYTLLTLSRILIFSSRLLILFPLFLFMQRYYNYYLLSDGFDTKCCCCCASVYTARKLSQPEKIPKNPQASSPLCPVVLIFQPFFSFYFISFHFYFPPWRQWQPMISWWAWENRMARPTGHKKKEKFNTTSLLCALGLVLLLLSLFGFAVWLTLVLHYHGEELRNVPKLLLTIL